MKARTLERVKGLAVRIPKPISDDNKPLSSAPLEIAGAVDGVVQMHRAREIATLAELVAEITPENRYAEISSGLEIGREAAGW
jgi:antitoxin component of MazEF toxin-antitoxin module